jgi:mono/diheme cytochrome c family protein
MAGAVGSAFAADAAAGKAVYTKRCQNCHGPKGEGNPNVAKMLKTTIAPLGSSAVQGKSDDDLKKSITKGIGKMKPVALTDAEASDVVAYVRTLK